MPYKKQTLSMSINKNELEKTRLHSRNKNRERYDLSALSKISPELATYVKPNKFGADSVDFSNPVVVKLLNKALLHHYYGIKNWNFPDDNLCPPIPGRADYIHHIADVLASINNGKVPAGDKIKALDIGVGANCVYPIIGTSEYGWKFVGADIDKVAIASAQKIVDENENPLKSPYLKAVEKLEIKLLELIELKNKYEEIGYKVVFTSIYNEKRG